MADAAKQIIAVTGPMASGKNFVCSIFENDGWKSIDADILVHQAIDELSQTIYETFSKDAQKHGINILTDDKTKNQIDRKALGKLLFSDPSLLKKQEMLVYPYVIRKTKEFINKNDKVIINATVLYKTPELLNLCQKIYYIKAPFLKRLIRAKKRDRLPLKQILKRFKNQRNLLKEYQKFSVPIFIWNN
ncbi:MAG: dephospho-CoA kinase [Treponema sp.]|nr:dephospho-CoA kinase [Treponema sp.]